MTVLHPDLAAGRWQSMSLAAQLGNVGSEVSRAVKAKEAGKIDRLNSAIARMLELLDLTIADPKNRHGLKELCRIREVLCDFFAFENEYGSTAEDLNRYFTPFALASRTQRGVQSRP